MNKYILFLFFLFPGSPATAVDQGAIVQVYVTVQGSKGKYGTGFFVNSSGQFTTAYHVVEGARKIRLVTADNKIFDNIRVDFISPDHDIAILQIIKKVSTPVYLQFYVTMPKISDRILATGNPRGIAHQSFFGHITSEKFLSSHVVSDQNGKAVFNTEISPIDLLPLDLTIYTGMSGGPVIFENKVIAILSASYSEGGSLVWGIPAKYVHEKYLKRIDKNVSDMSWPEFKLLSTGSRSLEILQSFDASDAALLEQFFTEGEAFEKTFLDTSNKFSSCAATFDAWKLMKGNNKTSQKKQTNNFFEDQFISDMQACLGYMLIGLEKLGDFEYALSVTYAKAQNAINNRISTETNIEKPKLAILSLQGAFPSIFPPQIVSNIRGALKKIPTMDPSGNSDDLDMITKDLFDAIAMDSDDTQNRAAKIFYEMRLISVFFNRLILSSE